MRKFFPSLCLLSMVSTGAFAQQSWTPAPWRQVEATGLESQKDKGAFAASGTALTSMVRATWPTGYMSVVVPVPGAPRAPVAGGLAGSGYSVDGGQSWTVLDRTPINTVGFASPATGWAVGPQGLLMKYAGPAL